MIQIDYKKRMERIDSDDDLRYWASEIGAMLIVLAVVVAALVFLWSGRP